MTYTLTAPATPGATPTVASTHSTLESARAAARTLSRGRPDLRGQDVRIDREDGSLVEYAGLGS